MSASGDDDLRALANGGATAWAGDLAGHAIGGQRLAQVGERHLLADLEARR